MFHIMLGIKINFERDRKYICFIMLALALDLINVNYY